MRVIPLRIKYIQCKRRRTLYCALTHYNISLCGCVGKRSECVHIATSACSVSTVQHMKLVLRTWLIRHISTNRKYASIMIQCDSLVVDQVQYLMGLPL